MDLADIRQLYQDGRTGDALEALNQLNLRPDAPDFDDAQALRAWCHYRRKEYPETMTAVNTAGEHTWALECRLYLHAYVPLFQNDHALRQLAEKLGNELNVNAVNALVIRSRAADADLLTHEEVKSYASRFAGSDVAVANLKNNAGRFFHEKARHSQDLAAAIAFYLEALELYGSDSNWHHRGALNYHLSCARETRHRPADAVPAAEESVRCWEEQLKRDPTNASFSEKLTAARQYLAHLVTTSSQ